MAGEFDGKVVVITGAGGGVGSVVAREYGAAGAKLALWELHPEKLQPLVEEIGAARALAGGVNLTDADAVHAALAQTVEHYGQIDVLLHIAGGFAMPGAVHEGHIDVWHKMMALNATATYITCGAVAGHMVERGIHGSIVMVAAKSAAQGGKHSAIYAASKSAVLRIMESMADELKPHHIRVNAISPSTIDTPANRDAMGDERAPRWVQPQEIAQTMMFLTSARGSAMTGANVLVNKWV